MNTEKNSLIGILGLSNHPQRYSYLAYKSFLEKGYNNLVGINPRPFDLENIQHFKNLRDLEGKIQTLTIYLRPEISNNMISDIIAVAPKRIILNPGAENTELETSAQEQRIEVLHACTLVMLSTGQF